MADGEKKADSQEQQQQQPGTSQDSSVDKDVQNKPAQAGKGRKRKHSTKRLNNNKRNGPSEDELDAEKLQFLLEPVLETLRSLTTGNEAETMKALLATLQPSQEEIEMALMKVKIDLNRVLGFANNNHTIYDFGSIKSGLAFRDSDLDFYIHYEKENENKQDQAKLIHVINGRMMRDNTFHGMVKILGAKVPLLRAIHHPTNLTCDINFSNARGCYNSKFIYAVTRFDSRIHKLAVIIKFWARCAYLLNNHRQMNTYCIIMMLIFYLQTKKLPLLPSVQDLQKGIPRINYGAWNLGYPRDISFASMNKESIRSLLCNFFKYYANFDFEKNLISPYVGRLCAVDEMRQSKVRELQPYYRAVEHQKYSPFNFGTMISIQDPFELNLNIGGVCNSVAHFEQFKLSFKTAYEVLCATNSEPFSKVLENLYTQVKRYQKPAKCPAQNPVNNGTKALDKNAQWRLCRLLPVEYELFIVRQILLATKKDKDAVINDRQINDMWGDCMLDFIEDILRKLFICQLLSLKDVERVGTVPERLKKEDIRSYQLSCERQAMFKRTRLQISNEEELDNEIAISKARWAQNRPLIFSTRMDMFKANDAVEIHLADEQRKSGTIRVFVETCLLTQIRKCTTGYFKVMLARAERRMKLSDSAMTNDGQKKTEVQNEAVVQNKAEDQENLKEPEKMEDENNADGQEKAE